MRRTLLAILLLPSLIIPSLAQSKITVDMLQALDEADGQPVRGVVLLADRVDLVALDAQLSSQRASLNHRVETVITSLQEKAAITQQPILNWLRSQPNDQVISFENYWITNAIFIQATSAVFIELANRQDVEYVDLEHAPKTMEPVEVQESSSSPNGREPGHDAINAPAMWKAGFTGEGVLVMNMDTGVDLNHPAINHNWLGHEVPAEQAWFGPGTLPTDCHGHGTHTLGTICGIDPATNDTIGVAFNAKWISAGAIDCAGNTQVAAFEWAIDPDGNPSTIDDMPAVIGNSWRWPFPSSCVSVYEEPIVALEAAGVAVVFAAGNEGPGVSTIGEPSILNNTELQVFTVGAVDGNNSSLPIASFSSRGPTFCEGEGNTIKPEVSAPGVAVRSSVSGTYQNWSGTSMACPHVAGAIALLKEAFPHKSGLELKEALYNTAVDKGVAGEDNDYGMGVIDVYAAFQSFADSLDPERPIEVAAYSDFNSPNSMQLNWSDPVRFGGGDTLLPSQFTIEIERNDAWVASVSGGVETYVDDGLTDGDFYSYSLYAKIIESDSTGNSSSASWYAGGSPIPGEPTNLACENADPEIVLSWSDPEIQEDGTPIDDLDSIMVYRDDVHVATLAAGVESFSDAESEFGTYIYHLVAVDNEANSNESSASDVLVCEGGNDTEAPAITHEPVPVASVNDLPVRVEATVVDNQGLDEVWVEYNINHGTTESFALTGAIQFYVGFFPFTADDIAIGDSVFYTVIARDISANQNTTWHGEHGFEVRNSHSYSQTVNAAIPNDDVDGISRIIGVFLDPDDAVLDVDVSFESVHPNLGDLSIWLTSPEGTQVKLMERPGHPAQPIGNPGENPNIWLDDDAEISIEDVEFENGEDVVGRFSPDPEMLSQFAGEEAGGQWTITVNDEWGPNSGTFLSWGMVITLDPATGIEDNGQLIPREFSVAQNYPNPFNPSTTIEYRLPEVSDIRLVIYNMIGQEVVELENVENQLPGTYSVNWNSSGNGSTHISSGIYLYKFEALGQSGERYVQTRKMLLLK